MRAVHKKDLLIIQGDWNAIVGNVNKDWSMDVGKFALGETKIRGIILLEFANKHNLTHFTRNKIQEKLRGTHQTVITITKLTIF